MDKHKDAVDDALATLEKLMASDEDGQEEFERVCAGLQKLVFPYLVMDLKMSWDAGDGDAFEAALLKISNSSPPVYDWQAYLDRYSDLAGLTVAQAEYHYHNSGQAEGRTG